MRSGSFGGPPGAARRFPGGRKPGTGGVSDMGGTGGVSGMSGAGGVSDVGSMGGVSDMGGMSSEGGIAIWAAGKRKRGKLCAKAFPFLCFSG